MTTAALFRARASLFRSRAFGANGSIASRSLGKPTAMYPGAVASDAQLTIAVDRLETRLAQPLSPIAVTMTVEDGTGIIPNTLLSIDDEIVRTQAGAGNVWAINRGFDGTTPATHMASAIVSGFVDAYHHNALVSEIQAIEQTLGPNLSNIPLASTFPPQPWSQTPPGGALVVGANVITLTPVPQGVNGSDPNHLLYVSGTGTPEAVPIIGGTAVSGAPTGTVIVTCAFAHPVGWTIGTATAGIQEAISLGLATYPNGFVVTIPPGLHVLWGPIQIPMSNITLLGSGMNATSLTMETPNRDAIQLIPPASAAGFYNSIRDLTLIAQVASTSGYAVNAVDQGYLIIEKVAFQNFHDGLYLVSPVQSVVRDVYGINMHGGNGMVITGPLTNVLVIDNFECFPLPGSSYACGILMLQSGNTLMSHISIIGADLGLSISPPAGNAVTSTDISLSFFDSSKFAGVRFGPAAGAGVSRTSFVQCWMSGGAIGGAVAFGVQFVGAGGATDGTKFTGCEISANGNNGINIPPNSNVQDLMIEGCTISNNASASGVSITDPMAGNVRITNCGIGNGLGGWPGGDQQIGINSVATTNQVYTANFFFDNRSTAISLPSTGLVGYVIANNSGIDDVIPAAPSAPSITLPANPILRLTGTTTVTQLLGAWSGRMLTLIKADAGSLTIGGGGNIPLSHTLPQNGSLILVYDGTNWS